MVNRKNCVDCFYSGEADEDMVWCTLYHKAYSTIHRCKRFSKSRAVEIQNIKNMIKIKHQQIIDLVEKMYEEHITEEFEGDYEGFISITEKEEWYQVTILLSFHDGRPEEEDVYIPKTIDLSNYRVIKMFYMDHPNFQSNCMTKNTP